MHTPTPLASLGRRTFLAPALAALGFLAMTACGQPQSSAPPAAPAPSLPTSPRLYVSNETGGHVVVIDPASASVIGRIEVGKRPRGLRLSPDGKTLFVALSGSPIAGPGVDESTLPPPDRSADGIGVVDLATQKLVRVMESGQDPENFAISPDGTHIYVSNEETSEMSVVDVASGKVSSHVKVGDEPEGVGVRPGGAEVYVTSESDSEVAAIDTTSFKVLAEVKTSARPRGVAFTRDGKIAFITNENGGSVTVIDADAHQVLATIPMPEVKGAPAPPRPMGMAFSQDGQTLFVSLGRAAAIAKVDVATRKVTGTFDNVGARLWGIALSADGQKIYSANGPSGDVSVVDVATGKVETRIPTGGSPWGVVVRP
jgi:YVTN family beta-propeller protein